MWMPGMHPLGEQYAEEQERNALHMDRDEYEIYTEEKRLNTLMQDKMPSATTIKDIIYEKELISKLKSKKRYADWFNQEYQSLCELFVFIRDAFLADTDSSVITFDSKSDGGWIKIIDFNEDIVFDQIFLIRALENYGFSVSISQSGGLITISLKGED